MPKIESECHGKIHRPRFENPNPHYQNPNKNNMNNQNPNQNFGSRPFFMRNDNFYNNNPNNNPNRNNRKNGMIYPGNKGPMFGNMNPNLNNNILNPGVMRGMPNNNFGQFVKGYPNQFVAPPQQNVQKVNLSMINNSNINIKINVSGGNELKMDGFLNNSAGSNNVNNVVNNNNGFRPMNKDKNPNNGYPGFVMNTNNTNNNNINNNKNPLKRKNSNHFNEFEDSEKKNKKIKENDLEFSFFNNNNNNNNHQNQKNTNFNLGFDHDDPKKNTKICENAENLDINKSKHIYFFHHFT